MPVTIHMKFGGGFPDPDNCISDSNTICGTAGSSPREFTLTKSGIWRAVIIFGVPSVALKFEHATYKIIDCSGVGATLNISTSGKCSGYFKISVLGVISETYVSKIALIST